MTKQLFIYENATPISASRHGDMSVRTGEDWGFAARINSAPLLIGEFAAAARSLPIVFAGTAERVIPIVVLGVRDQQNVFIDADGKWAPDYTPAFLRQYPFVLGQTAESPNFILCLDETFPGCNREGRGERLFDSEGRRTAYLDKMIDFAKEYQRQFTLGQRLGAKLAELGLLEPMRATFRTPDGTEQLQGFQTVRREKLMALKPEEIAALHASGMLEAIYLHLFSLANFRQISRALEAGAEVVAETV
ncbi:MAG: SapC family protein [Sphingomonadales bacterium]|nr:SapC family protein [Sphingomonadales bacterium]